MKNQKILSLCIPTNGVTHWVLPTLEHIYNQECDTSLFEVIITDNGNSEELNDEIIKRNYPNLTYLRTNDKGFLNQITCFKQANGLFIRMLNHRSILLPGILKKWIEIIKKYQKEKPIIYFSDGVFKKNIIECSNFEEFVKEMSYYSSWSAGVSFWNIDKETLNNIVINKMFPTTSILFEIRKKSKYIIWNEKYQELQDETGKGGYNIYKTFAVDYLDILNELRLKDRISIKTFIQIKSELILFLQQWYDILSSKTNKYTFDTSDMDLYLEVYYTKEDIKSIRRNKIRILNKILKTKISKLYTIFKLQQ